MSEGGIRSNDYRPPTPPVAYSLQVTIVLRREHGEWKIVHRHADPAPDDDFARDQLQGLKAKREGG